MMEISPDQVGQEGFCQRRAWARPVGPLQKIVNI